MVRINNHKYPNQSNSTKRCIIFRRGVHIIIRVLPVIQKMLNIAWIALAFYLLAETVRTMIIDQGQHIARLFILYLGLIILFVVTKKYKDIDYKYLFILIAVLCIFYYSAYIIQGLVAEYILHTSKYASQSITWAGSAYAVLPLLIGIPVGMALFNHVSVKIRVLGALIGVFSVGVHFYYSSRVLLAILMCYVVLSFFVLNWKKALTYTAIVLLTLAILITGMTIRRSADSNIKECEIDTVYIEGYRNIFSYLPKILYSGGGIDSVRDTDQDRVLHAIAPIQAVLNSPYFGYGTYQSHYVLKTYLANLGEYHESDKIYTTGFSSFLTDFGFVGFGLLVLIYIFNFFLIIFKRGKYWLFVVFALCFSFVWLFINNILDNMLWWLLLCPYGLLWRLNNEERDNKLVDTDSVSFN